MGNNSPSPPQRDGLGRALAGLVRDILKSNMAIAGFSIVLIICCAALLAPIIATHDPYEGDFAAFLRPPGGGHIFGTDHLGRDIFSRVIYGTRISLEVGFISVLIGNFLGVPIGLIAGYFGKATDTILMRLMDSFLAFPELLLAITLVAVLGPSTISVMIALGIVYMPIMARITRSRVVTEKNKEYILAGYAIGQKPLVIIFGHILPNSLQAIIVQSTVNFTTAILVEAALSFLGIGTPPPIPSWGRMLYESKGYIGVAPFTAVFPGVMITLAVLGFNMLGDGLREVLDPRVARK